jgi:hypothetical protein
MKMPKALLMRILIRFRDVGLGLLVVKRRHVVGLLVVKRQHNGFVVGLKPLLLGMTKGVATVCFITGKPFEGVDSTLIGFDGMT